MSDERNPSELLHHAVHRAQWAALGIAAKDLERPRIAIVNSSSAISICYQRVDELAARVAAGVRSAGGLPFEIRTCAPSDGLFFVNGKGHLLPAAREAIVRDVEIMVEGAQLQGIVFLSSCDSTTPAHLVAAAKLDLPAIVVGCGYQHGPRGDAERDMASVYEGIGAVATGRMSANELEALASAAVGCPGVCPGLGTATSMHMVAEALGLALAGSTPACGGGTALLEHAQSAGARAVQLVREQVRAGSILTTHAFENAMLLIAAVGGAASTVSHLDSVARAAGVVFDAAAALSKLDGKVGLLCAIAPNGSGSAADLERAGGTRGVMRQLSSHLHLDVATVSGTSLRHVLNLAPAPDERVIRPLSSPIDTRPGLQVLRWDGSANGGIVRRAGVKPGQHNFRGPVQRLGSAADALEALARGDVRPERVLVVADGVDDFACALAGADLIDRVAILTNGGYSGLGRGLVVGYLPPLQLDNLKDGDSIEIDLDAGCIRRTFSDLPLDTMRS